MKTRFPLRSGGVRVARRRAPIAALSLAALLLGSLPSSVAGADRFWSNTNGGAFHTGGNWIGGAVPGEADTANFTNAAGFIVSWTLPRTNHSASFNSVSGSITQAITTQFWRLTNSYVLGTNAGLNPRVTLISGTLAVTNSAGNAVLEVRRGTNHLVGGTVIADLLRLTNTAGRLVFSGGTLVTRGGAVSNGLTLTVGASGATPAVWDVRAGAAAELQGAISLGEGTVGATLLLTNGGKLLNTSATVGTSAGSNFAWIAGSNFAWIAGSGSVWSNRTFLDLGSATGSSLNRLVISNGAWVSNESSYLGSSVGANSNLALVTGAGSVWSNRSDLRVGSSGGNNSLVISNGARAIVATTTTLGNAATATNNTALVSGLNSFWTNGTSLTVGNNGAGNLLRVENQGVVVTPSLLLGANATGANNRVAVAGGALYITNATGTALCDLRRGTNLLVTGLWQADRLLLTNAAGFFEFPAGNLRLRSATVANGRAFRIGDGVSIAQLLPTGTGSFHFADGLTVLNRGIFDGNATLGGVINLQLGGFLSPAYNSATGRILLTNAPTLAGRLYLEVSKAGGVTTNDVLQVLAPLTLGGVLEVSDLGPEPLVAGDRFPLLEAPAYAGAFASLVLPEIAPELMWSNRLAVDGSLTVVARPPGDCFWTNSLSGSYLSTGNWLGQLVPRGGDTAHFTNAAGYTVTWPLAAAAAGARFNAASGIVTQSMPGSSWLLTNDYVLGDLPGAAPTVAHVSGALRVTNAAGSGRFEVRAGTFRLLSGTVETDRWVQTNAAGQFHFSGGTLITRGGTISNGNALNLGDSETVPAVWDVRDGEPTEVRSELFLGVGTMGATLLVTNGGPFSSRAATLGSVAAGNLAFVAGAGSVWSNQTFLDLGFSGTSGRNRLVVSNGGWVINSSTYVGAATGSRSNLALVTGAGSVWSNRADLLLGRFGGHNTLAISNGARVVNLTEATLGKFSSATNNTAVVSGAQSVWTNALLLTVGESGAANLLRVESQGTVLAPEFVLGAEPTSTNNRVEVDGGALVITNATGNALCDLRRGTNELRSGSLTADRLLLTNSLGTLSFLGGTLTVRTAIVDNARELVAGEGVNGATLAFNGFGQGNFAQGLVITNGAHFEGSAALNGPFTLRGTFSPVTASPTGRVVFSHSPVLAGGLFMELGLFPGSRTNDVLEVAAPLTFGGDLLVSAIGPDAFAPGDRFRLFVAPS